MLNMDMNKPVIVDSTQLNWQASPLSGVWRKPLAREAAEKEHATSIARFEAGSQFSEHGHPLGEEILVLAGTFSDHTGDFTSGSYFRNPPGFVHTPFSLEGCTLFVKIHQFQADDKHRVCINYQDIDASGSKGGPEQVIASGKQQVDSLMSGLANKTKSGDK